MKALTILLILLCSVASAQVQLDNVQADNTHMSSYEKLFTFNPSTNTITGFTGIVNGRLIIPQTIDGVQVLNLGAGAFYNKYVKSVSLPSGLLTIGTHAFAVFIGGSYRAIAQQTDLTIPSSVTLIDTWAFASWPLTKITIGATVNIVHGFAMGTYGVAFKAFYDAGGKLAGTYEYIEGSWVKTS
jgi:hypothetical protein